MPDRVYYVCRVCGDIVNDTCEARTHLVGHHAHADDFDTEEVLAEFIKQSIFITGTPKASKRENAFDSDDIVCTVIFRCGAAADLKPTDYVKRCFLSAKGREHVKFIQATQVT